MTPTRRSGTLSSGVALEDASWEMEDGIFSGEDGGLKVEDGKETAFETPICGGGCAAGCEGHSMVFDGNGNSGSDGVESSVTGLISKGFPMASICSSPRLCVFALEIFSGSA